MIFITRRVVFTIEIFISSFCQQNPHHISNIMTTIIRAKLELSAIDESIIFIQLSSISRTAHHKVIRLNRRQNSQLFISVSERNSQYKVAKIKKVSEDDFGNKR